MLLDGEKIARVAAWMGDIQGYVKGLNKGQISNPSWAWEKGRLKINDDAGDEDDDDNDNQNLKIQATSFTDSFHQRNQRLITCGNELMIFASRSEQQTWTIEIL